MTFITVTKIEAAERQLKQAIRSSSTAQMPCLCILSPRQPTKSSSIFVKNAA